MEMSLLTVGDWTREPLEVPSSLAHSMISLPFLKSQTFVSSLSCDVTYKGREDFLILPDILHTVQAFLPVQ